MAPSVQSAQAVNGDRTMPSLRQVAAALPSHRPRALPRRRNPAKPMPAVLPPCFAQVWARRHSTLPHHVRQRTVLDAIASELPAEAKSLSGSSAAAAYLAALVSALDRFVATSDPVAHSRPRAVSDHRLSKKAASRARREAALGEADVANSSVPALFAMTAQKAAMNGAATMQDDDHPEEHEFPPAVGTATAFTSLIAMAVQGSSHAIINAKAEHILKSVLAAYDHVSGFPSVAHHTNMVIAGTLAVLSPSVWPTPVVQKSFLYLLRHTADLDEGLARNSRRALLALLNCPRGTVVRAKASASASSYFVAEIAHMMELCQGDDASPANQTHLQAFHNLLTSIEGYGAHLLPGDAAVVAGELVMVAVKNIGIISTGAFGALATLFSEDEKDNSADDKTPLLRQNDMNKLLEAILRHEMPEDSDETTLSVYASCVAAGTKAHLYFFEHFSPPSEFVLDPMKALVDLLDPSGGRSNLVRSVCRELQGLIGERWLMNRPEVVTMLQAFIELKYRPIWADTLPVLRRYVENGMASSHFQLQEAITALIKLLISKREKAKSEHDVKTEDMVSSVLKAISRGGGCALLLKMCKVEYDKDTHITNRWLPPLLRDNIVGAPLLLFTSNILPVIETLTKATVDMLGKKRVIEAKNIGICTSQLWALLPGFCNKPSDLGHEGVMSSTFRAIHMSLTAKDSDVLNAIGISALRQLSNSVLSLSSIDLTAKQRSEAFATRFKKMFPFLVGAVPSIPEQRRGMLLEVITIGCRATRNSATVSGLLRKSIRKLLDAQIEAKNPKEGKKGASEEPTSMETDDREQPDLKRRQHCSADVVLAIADSRVIADGAAELGFLQQALSPFLEDRRDASLQKKAYRAAAILLSPDGSRRSTDGIIKLAEGVAAAQSTLAAGARAARQGWIAAVVNAHLSLPNNTDRADFLKRITPVFLSEILLATRDASERSRTAAHYALTCLARAWHSLPSSNGGLRNLFTAVAGGLAGQTAVMVAGALSGLSGLLMTFRHELGATGDEELRKVVDELFASAGEDADGAETVRPGPIAIVMRHESAEVRRAAVGVMKTATRVLSEPTERLRIITAGVVPGLVYVAAGSEKRETRLRVRVVLERLLRRLGDEVMDDLFPGEHRPLLAAVRKELGKERRRKVERKERLAEARLRRQGQHEEEEEGHIIDGDEVSDSDSDVERELVEGTESAKGHNGRAHGLGGSGAEVVDLLEARAGLVGVRRSSTRATIAKLAKGAMVKSRKSHDEQDEGGVKYTEDGKPIFVESDDESGDAEAGSMDGIDSDDDDDGDVAGGKGGRREEMSRMTGRKRGRDGDNGAERHGKKGKGSFGEEFRSKRGAGDVKRAGRPDPYAYVPLGASMFGSVGGRGKRTGGGGGGGLRAVIGNGRRKARGRRSGAVPARR